MKTIIISLLLSTCAMMSLNAVASIVVIFHPSNTNNVDAKQIRSMYLAKTHVFPDGEKVTPLDVADESEVKKIFSKKVLRKSPSSLNSYWSRMIFSAKGKPPKALSMSGVKARVAIDKNAMGYIDSELVDDSVKVILTLD